MTFRALELFSGLGGWRYALGGLGTVVAAYDISDHANATYALNHGDRPRTRELASIPAADLLAHGADLWMLSPPCQPCCRMGNKLGLGDPRSAAFLHLMDVMETAPPDRLVLENVEGFLGSDAHELLMARLEQHGLHRLELRLCPSAFGIPNLRPRVFIVASRDPISPRPMPAAEPTPLSAWLEEKDDPSLYLAETDLERHGPGLDLVTPLDHRSACFIGGYGQRFMGSGSFLRTPRGVRRFSTREIARLMGLPEAFRFPASVPLEKRYKLLGNGLNIDVARWVVAHLAG